ncbi:MAG: hypothetical protein JXM79_07615, partial [Sedimentisphaerales bacterium]|nr:hypothetical protein [Sedimentisphaerales bacterium]
MKEYEADFDIRMMYKGRLDFAIEALLTTLLAFMPFAFGADRAWSKEVVIALSGMIVVCFLLKVLHHGDQGLIGSWSYLLLALFVLVAVFQLIPFSTHFVRIISPNTIALRQELLGDLPGADTLLKTASLSFYANATRHDLRLIVSIAAVFVVTVNFFRSPDQIKRLLMTIALIGGIVAAFTLIQFLFRNGKIYWFIDWKRSQAISGPFVNHNNYAQFMNLSIGAALGCILVSLHEYFAGRKVTPFVIYDYLSSRSAKFFWLLVIIVTVGIATIFISLSRGGMVSLLIASVFMTLLLVSRPSLKGRGWIMAIIALGAFACILFVGFDAVYARYGDLSLSMSLKARMQIMRDLVSSYGQF